MKLLLVDDHPVVRSGISSCLTRQERFAILGEAADGLEAVRKAKGTANAAAAFRRALGFEMVRRVADTFPRSRQYLQAR